MIHKWDEKKNFHNLLKKLKTPLDCPAMTWKLEDDYHSDNGDGDFDEEVFPVLIPLNNKKWHTVASCAGHTQKDIEKYHIAYGVSVPFRVVIYIHVSITKIDEFRDMVEKMKQTTDGYFICSIGSNKEEFSNETEKGFLPFVIEVHCYTKEKRDQDLLVLAKVAKAHNKK